MGHKGDEGRPESIGASDTQQIIMDDMSKDKNKYIIDMNGYPRPQFTGYNLNDGMSDGPSSFLSRAAIILSSILLVIIFPLVAVSCIYVVREYERLVVFRLGRIINGRARGPGIFFINPFIDTATVVDLRTISFSVPPQQVLSKDSVTVTVDAVVYYRIADATVATTNVQDFSGSTRLLAATTLRTVLGTKNLSEILSEREAISNIMQHLLDETTEPWGVKVERVEIKDATLPSSLQRVMAAEAEAVREARAKIIYSEGEQKASLALRQAAEVISTSPQALQLRYLQALNSIAAEKSSTIVFPIPLEMFSAWKHCGQQTNNTSNPLPPAEPSTSKQVSHLPVSASKQVRKGSILESINQATEVSIS